MKSKFKDFGYDMKFINKKIKADKEQNAFELNFKTEKNIVSFNNRKRRKE